MATLLCHAVDCNERIPGNRLMCPAHWFMVPEGMRREVWRNYRPGQEDDLCPSQAWIDASREAINSVARAEGKPELPTTERIRKTLEELIAKRQNSSPSPSKGPNHG